MEGYGVIDGTFKPGINVFGTKRTCPIHGPQGDEAVTIRLTGTDEHYCLACFAAWVRANLQPLTPTVPS